MSDDSHIISDYVGYGPGSPHECNLDELVFKGHLAAPGIGMAYECPVCLKAFHKNNAHSKARPFDQLDPDDFILRPEDFI